MSFNYSMKKYINEFSKIFDKIKIGTYSVKTKNITLQNPDKTFNECLISGNEYNYIIKVEVDILQDDGVVIDNCSTEFSIPKQYQNTSFLFKNVEGTVKQRSSITIGNIIPTISVYKDSVETPFFYIKKEKNNFYIKIYKDKKTYEFYNFIDSMTSELDINYNSKEFKALRQKYYFLYKKDIEVITKENLLEIFDSVFVNYNPKFDNFSIFDVEFISQFDSIIHELTNTKSFNCIARKISQKYLKTKIFEGNFVTTEINKIFSMRAEDFDSIQTSSDSNALSVISQSKKIYFVKRGKKQKLNYTNDFLGVVCPLKTPEGASLANVKNELTKDVILDHEPYIPIWELSKKVKTEITVFEFYRSKVIIPEYIDYSTKRIKPLDKIQYLFEGKFYYINYNDVDINEYICLNSKNGFFSYCASYMPFLDSTDSVRTSMATGMFEQTIPVIGAKINAVSTEVEQDIYLNSQMNTYSPVNGKVIGIFNQFIKIRCDDGTNIIVTIPQNSKTVQNTYNCYEPTVKIGDYVREGEILISSNSFKKQQLAIGVPMLIAYDFYGFYGEEDGFLISESASKWLGHKMNHVIKIEIDFDSFSLFNNKEIDNLDKYGLPIIGKTYSKGETFCFYKQMKNVSKIDDFDSILSVIDKKYKTITHKIPNNIENLYIEKINVSISKKVKKDSSSSNELEVYNYINEINRDNDKQTNLFVSDSLRVESLQLKCNQDIKFTLEIIGSYIHIADEGAKLCNRYGSKGSVVKVLPDNLMPKLNNANGETIHAIILSTTRINRKNLSGDKESLIGYCSHICWKQNDLLIKENNINKVRENLSVLFRFYPTKEEISDEKLIAFHNFFTEEQYYQVIINPVETNYKNDVILSISEYFGINAIEGENVYIPSNDTILENKISVGITTLLRLHFLQDHKMTATGIFNNEKKLTGGIGEFRDNGQKLGEMESWTIYIYDCFDVMENILSKNLKKEISQGFTNQLNAIGLKQV